MTFYRCACQSGRNDIYSLRVIVFRKTELAPDSFSKVNVGAVCRLTYV